MSDRDSVSTSVSRPVGETVALWLGLGRGWQAVLLGVAIVFACHLLA